MIDEAFKLSLAEPFHDQVIYLLKYFFKNLIKQCFEASGFRIYFATSTATATTKSEKLLQLQLQRNRLSLTKATSTSSSYSYKILFYDQTILRLNSYSARVEKHWRFRILISFK